MFHFWLNIQLGFRAKSLLFHLFMGLVQELMVSQCLFCPSNRSDLEVNLLARSPLGRLGKLLNIFNNLSRCARGWKQLETPLQPFADLQAATIAKVYCVKHLNDDQQVRLQLTLLNPTEAKSKRSNSPLLQIVNITIVIHLKWYLPHLVAPAEIQTYKFIKTISHDCI